MAEHRTEGFGEADARQMDRDETTEAGGAPVQGTALIADPLPVGLAGFALTVFVLSIINAGWLDQIGTFIPLALFYGGLGQLLAGMWAFRSNENFAALMFTSYGMLWAAFGFQTKT